jgi:hypothetical protein
MTIKQQGGVFGRHPKFSSAEIDGPLDVDGLTTLNVGADGPIIDLQKNGSSVGAIGASGSETYVNSTSTLRFRVANNVKASLNSVGAYYPSTTNVSDLGLNGLRWRDLYLTGNVILASGAGIDFSATSGTGTSELFDDYEEGTWTPVATSITINSGTPVWSGTYTKVGRTVVAEWVLSGGANIDVSLSSYISLPFTAAGNSWGTYGIVSTNTHVGGMVTFGSSLYFGTASSGLVSASGTIMFQV